MHRYFYLLKAKRCGAKTRKGTLCKAPAIHGKNRCRMHGGAIGNGAPLGNKNALRHGYYTKMAMEEKRNQKLYLRELRKFIEGIKIRK